MAENYITCSGEKGSIHISEDVIAVMVAAAISEVPGVSGLSNSVGAELSDFLGKKSISKGVKVSFQDSKITVDTIILVKYGFEITGLAEAVQTAVSSAVAAMTGMGAPMVNVHVSGVTFDK